MAMNEMDMSEMMPDESMQTLQMSSMEKEAVKNPIEIIKNDHRKVESLFEQFEGAEDKKQKLEIAKQVCIELTVHAQYEEELVYPLLMQEDEEAGIEAGLEHELIKFMIDELNGIGARDKKLEPKVKVLKDLVQHHVEEEERTALPELEGNEELQARADQIIERKMQLMKKMTRGGRKASTALKPAARKATTGRKKTTARKPHGMRKTAARGSSAGKRTAATAKKGARKSAQVRSGKKQTTRRAR